MSWVEALFRSLRTAVIVAGILMIAAAVILGLTSAGGYVGGPIGAMIGLVCAALLSIAVVEYSGVHKLIR